jgi:hypothetical protein
MTRYGFAYSWGDNAVRQEAVVAEAIETLIEQTLARAATEPGGMSLVSTKQALGFFPNTAAGKTAAKRACDHGWFAFGPDGKTAFVTPKGLEHLLTASNPKPILDDFVRVLEAREEQVNQLIDAARGMANQVAAMRSVIESILPKVIAERSIVSPATVTNRVFPKVERYESDSGTSVITSARLSVGEAIMNRLHSFPATAGEDCPLPILFRDLPTPTTVGVFHDSLRMLHAEGRIFLHPWTGPLYQLPEPGLSLLVGHEVAYYASLK